MKSRVLSDKKVREAIAPFARFVLDASARDRGSINQIRSKGLGLPGLAFIGADQPINLIGGEISVATLVEAADTLYYAN